jgi:hypothetical protein
MLLAFREPFCATASGPAKLSPSASYPFTTSTFTSSSWKTLAKQSQKGVSGNFSENLLPATLQELNKPLYPKSSGLELLSFADPSFLLSRSDLRNYQDFPN